MVSISSASLFSTNSVTKNSANVALIAARLASGNRLSSAADDVSALAIGTALNTQVTGLRAALSNVTQASSLLQVADGGISQQLDILERQKALAVQASSGQINDSTRSALNQEFQGLSAQLDQIAGSTSFNGVPLLSGGLNTSTTLSSTDVLSAAFTPTAATGSNASSAANSTVAIQAFNSVTGAALSGGSNAGNLDVTDSSGHPLSNGAFNGVDSSLAGGISNFTFSNVNYGVSATLSATVGGVNYSGTYTNGATSAVLTNGNTSITVATGTSAGAAAPVSIADAAAVASSQAGLNNVFATTEIQRVNVVNGVDFSGTALAGASGTAASGGIAVARLNSATANIGNFQYVGNSGAANTNTLSVDINGQTFTATGVKDSLTSANGTIVFQSADNQVLKLDLTGLSNPLTNIRTDSQQQGALISALNSGFAKAGGGLNFTTGSAATDTLQVNLGDTSANALFNGQPVDIRTQGAAQSATAAIDAAIATLTAAQANVGGLQAQFDASGADLASAIQTQTAASSDLLSTDIAAESSNFSAAKLQQQASVATHAQVNKLSQSLLKLVQ